MVVIVNCRVVNKGNSLITSTSLKVTWIESFVLLPHEKTLKWYKLDT